MLSKFSTKYVNIMSITNSGVESRSNVSKSFMKSESYKLYTITITSVCTHIVSTTQLHVYIIVIVKLLLTYHFRDPLFNNLFHKIVPLNFKTLRTINFIKHSPDLVNK